MPHDFPTTPDSEGDWLQKFVEYTSNGEASPRLMYWVGVATLAGVLQRKVWFDMGNHIISPNFYILIVGEQGMARKSSSIDLGLNLLRELREEVGKNILYLGPHESTWEALLKELAHLNDHQQVVLDDGEIISTASCTMGLSEFGTMYKKEANNMVQGLTDIWDNKPYFEKATIKRGVEHIQKPWLNMIAGTTPEWIAENFSDAKLRGGLVSRFIFLYGEEPIKDISYPKHHSFHRRRALHTELKDHLRELLKFNGEVDLTPEAYEWGDGWYKALRQQLREHRHDTVEGGYLNRKQAHLHKMAIVIAASKSHLPVVTLEDMQEADKILGLMEGDAKLALGMVGQTRITGMSIRVIEEVQKAGGRVKLGFVYAKLWRAGCEFTELKDAVVCAYKAGKIGCEGRVDDVETMLVFKGAEQ